MIDMAHDLVAYHQWFNQQYKSVPCLMHIVVRVSKGYCTISSYRTLQIQRILSTLKIFLRHNDRVVFGSVVEKIFKEKSRVETQVLGRDLSHMPPRQSKTR